MGIYSCKDCVAPKRRPGCHGSCPDYLAEKAEHDRLKAIYDRERDINQSIVSGYYEKVERAMKYRRNKKV